MGLYQICMSLFMLLACFSASGLPLTLSRKTAENEVLEKFDRQKSMFSTTILTGCIIALAFCLFFYIFNGTLKYIFNDERCVDMFLLMLPALVTTSIYGIVRAWFWGKKDYVVYSLAEAFEEVVKVLFTILFVMVIFNAKKELGLAVAFLAADAVCAVLLIILFFKKGGKIKKPGYFPEIMKSAAPVTSTRILGSLATSITALLLPVLLTNFGLSTSEATAAYGRASGMVMPMIFAPTGLIGALAVVILPELAGQRVKGQKAELQKNINNALLLSCFIACAFFAVYACVGKELGLFLYDDVYAGEYLVRAAVIAIPMCLNQIASTILNTMGEENKTFISSIIGLSILLLTSLTLPKFIGIYAYFAGLFAYHCVTLILNFFFLKKTGHIRLKCVPKLVLIIAVSALCALAGYLVAGLVSPRMSRIMTIIIVTATILLAYLLISLPLGLLKLLPKKSSKASRSSASHTASAK